MKKISFLLLIIFGLFFSLNQLLAQEEINVPSEEASNIITEETPIPTLFAPSQNIDENDLSKETLSQNSEIIEEDFGIENQKTLPSDGWRYNFKEAWRNIKATFVFNRIKKAELRAKYTNEKLFELKKTLENNQNETTQEKALKNYEEEKAKLEKIIEQIQEKTGKTEEIEKILTWLSQNQLKHILVLDKLSEKLPEKAAQKIAEVRDREIEKISARIEKWEETGKIDNILEKINRFEDATPRLQEIIKTQRFLKLRQEIQEQKEYLKGLPSEEKQEIREQIRERAQERFENQEQIKLELRERIREKTNEEICKNLCGDGICQRIVCMAIGCPCAESQESCPEDCKTQSPGRQQ